MSFKEQKIPVGDPGNTYKNYEVILHNIGNQTDAENNNNKFFSIELWKVSNDWYVYTNYGRVDDKEYTGVAGIYGPADEPTMKSFFESKWKEKSRKYKKIEFVKAKVGSPKARDKVYTVAEDAIPEEKKKKLQESKSSTIIKKIDIDPVIQRLVDQFYKESSTAITNNAAVTITKNGIETPLGVLSFPQLKTGREILGELGQYVKNNKKEEITKLTSSFYSIIPTKMGRKITDEHLIGSDQKIQEKLDLLQMMEDALEIGASTYISDIDTKYLNLGSDLELVQKDSNEYKRIVDKIENTRGRNHYHTTSKVLNIMKVKNKIDSPRFDGFNLDNMQELFHGSRNINISGILKSGMRIAPPEAPRSGLAFGRGAYFANSSTKSINYSLHPFPGVEKSKNCFLFLFDVKLGKQLVKDMGDGNEHEEVKKKNLDSTWGKAGRYLIHDEFIVYKLEQCAMRYLVELQR
jgi:poly [ADP-ribose] polymerase